MLDVALDYRPALLTSSGIGRAVRELARALAARPGLRLHLFGHSLARARRADRLPAGARLHRLPIPGRSLRWLAALGLCADRLGGAAAVFHWTDYVHPPVRNAAPVLTVHDLAFAEDPALHGPDQARELLQRTAAAAAAARAILVPSRATGRRVAEVLAPRAPVHVVPYGADHVPRRGPRLRPFQRPHLLVLGTVEPRKNHRRLLAAWRNLGEDRPPLVVVGRRGWLAGELAAELSAEQHRGRLLWLQEAGDEAAFALLRGALALVYPSLCEGFGFPPLEAMACGVPALVGDHPALTEVTDTAALVCDVRSEAALGQALARLIGDRALRERLAADGPRRAADFTWEKAAAAHEDAYRQVSA